MGMLGRILIGIPIFLFVSWIWWFFYDLLATAVGAISLGLARGMRRLFGLSGTWSAATTGASGLVAIGKVASTACFTLAVFVYAFTYPALGWLADGAMYWALFALLAVWAPGVFLLAFFAEELE